jgi:hypothetical protein
MKLTEILLFLKSVTSAGFTGSDVGLDCYLIYDYSRNENPLLDSDISEPFMFLTALWVALGGIFQCAILIRMRCKRDVDLMALPSWLRVMVYVTGPILMSPAVLHLYAAYLRIKSRTPRVIEGVNRLTTALKMAEVALESVPQLATQWIAVSIKGVNASEIMFRRSQQDLTTIVSPVQAASILTTWEQQLQTKQQQLTTTDLTNIVSPVQAASIVTSTVTVVISTVSWISQSRRSQFISPQHHDAASLVPVTLWLVSAFVSGTTGGRFYGMVRHGMCNLNSIVLKKGIFCFIIYTMV